MAVYILYQLLLLQILGYADDMVLYSLLDMLQESFDMITHARWEKDASNKTRTMELSIPRKSALNYLTGGIHFDNPSYQYIGQL